MLNTPEQYDTFKRLMKLNENEDFLTEELVDFLKRLIKSYEESH
tara:strand:- start:157 stop:288 length:132 start_codon:yes stop_codon:yes gene_type:complete